MNLYIVQNIQFGLGIVGSIASLLTFCVFSRKRFQNLSFSFYAKIMSLSDLFVLVNSMRHWSKLILNFDINSISTILCKFAEYSAYCFSSISVWLLALITFDRFITIIYPTRYGIFKKKCFQTILVMIIFICSHLLYLRIPLDNNLAILVSNDSNSNQTNVSLIRCELEKFTVDMINWLHLVNILVVILVLNNVLTTALIVSVLRSRGKTFISLNDAAGISKIKKRERRDRKFAMNSIMLNLTCLVFKMPFLVIELILFYVNLDYYLEETMFNIGVTFWIMDNGSAFFVNILTNSIFKEEFCKMLAICLSQNSQSVYKIRN